VEEYLFPQSWDCGFKMGTFFLKNEGSKFCHFFSTKKKWENFRNLCFSSIKFD
jgi:hypothetical protein